MLNTDFPFLNTVSLFHSVFLLIKNNKPRLQVFWHNGSITCSGCTFHVILTSLVQYDKVGCGFNQSEAGKYFE